MTAALAPPTESIFTMLPRWVAEADAVNIASGFFDHAPHDIAMAALHQAADSLAHQYTPSAGSVEMREELARFTQRWEGCSADATTEITITAGAAGAIALTTAALCGPGDTTLVIDPSYEQYAPAIHATGAQVVRAQLPSVDAHVTADLLHGALTDSATPGPVRLIMVNTPWNPTGRAFTTAEWQAVAEVAREHDAYVVSDEAYEHCSLTGEVHPGVLSSPVDPARRVKIGSFSKSLCATGWRVGYTVADAATTTRIRSRQQFGSFCANSTAQEAVRIVLADGFDTVRSDIEGWFQNRVNLLASTLEELGLPTYRPDYGFYVTVDVGQPGHEWVHETLADGGVAGLPISAFCGDDPGPWSTMVRFAACKTPATLQQACTVLRERLG